VSAKAGERILGNTLLVQGCPDDLHAKAMCTTAEGDLQVHFSDGIDGCFDAHFLRSYADTVAHSLSGEGKQSRRPLIDTDWLKPYIDSRAPDKTQVNLWTTDTGPALREATLEEATTLLGNLQMIQTLLRDGIIKIKDVSSPGPSALHAFVDAAFNGLQKDPSRNEANWEIAPKKDAASISYAPTLKLNNHTDQSLPNHGIPALFLVMHTVKGFGRNTFVDTYAVCEALRQRDPQAFELLSRYGNPQCRFTSASRADAAQSHTVNLCLLSGKPIIQTDDAGGVIRTQYNEVFRIPSELPYDVFKPWYAAYIKFGLMIHSKEFERRVDVEAGQIVIVNNWRVMHGRDGNWDGTHSETIQSSDRFLTGGTVTRENMISKARDLLKQLHGAELHGTQLLS
jgi:alpha-ketoglutarate-dependent taurine dioxygenase